MTRRIEVIFLALVPAIFAAASVIGFGSPVKRVDLYIDGREISVRTGADSVGSLLAELKIPVKPDDELYPSGKTQLSDNQVILVTKKTDVKAANDLKSPITHSFIEQQVVVPYKTVQKPSKYLARGRVRRIVRGKNGLTLVRYKITLVKGKEIKREPVMQKVLVSTRNEVVIAGNGSAVYASRSRSGSYTIAKAPNGGSAMYVTATGYWKWVTGSGITATGRKAGYGIVAVDPRVIPLGTKLYVPGYGYALAADTGGAIKGNKIDLCFNTHAEAKRYGRRRLTVQIVR